MYYYAPYEADRFEGQKELIDKYNLTKRKIRMALAFI